MSQIGDFMVVLTPGGSFGAAHTLFEFCEFSQRR
jgi:hypothetical protein